MDRAAISVTELTLYIKDKLEGDFLLRDVIVRGEISNCKKYSSGHLYFSLKDSGSALRAVMFQSSALKLKFAPKDGMKVLATGRIGVYPASGEYQLYVSAMEPDGIGALYLAYEQLKKKLEAEGLFAQERKKKIPMYPRRIGVITSPSGAAVRDIINITGRRFPCANVILYPSLVQGEDAPKSLISGLSYFHHVSPVDVIIIGRGGGSIEDLWGFNDEKLARCVAASKIPVISAVGHETDFTLCDFASDLRAPTPSAGAELAVPDTGELNIKLDRLLLRMDTSLSHKIKLLREKTENLGRRRVLTTPQAVIDDKRYALSVTEERLISRTDALLKRKAAVLASVSEEKLYMKMDAVLKSVSARLGQNAAHLSALDPLAVVSRGYAAAFSEKGVPVKSVDSVKPGDKLKLTVSDGDIMASVDNIRRKENGK